MALRDQVQEHAAQHVLLVLQPALRRAVVALLKQQDDLLGQAAWNDGVLAAAANPLDGNGKRQDR